MAKTIKQGIQGTSKKTVEYGTRIPSSDFEKGAHLGRADVRYVGRKKKK